MFNIKAKYYIYLLFILLVLIVILYIYLYISQVEKISLNYPSYKTFLLKETKSFNRIIIDSGSNSTYGINSEMMEKEFNKVVINISDNAGVPLKHKLLRIKEFSKSGDIVIMPLEYPYYSYEGIPKSYFDKEFIFYFKILPLFEKIKFIVQTPFDSVMKLFLKYSLKVDNKNYFIEQFNDGKRGDLEFIYRGKLDVGTKNDTCENYIFSSNIKYNFSINQDFKKNIKLIKEIEKERKIKFIFTYPTIAGNNCYEGKYSPNFNKLDNEIKKYLKKNNIDFIGNFEDSYFPEKYMNDTYYHVLPEARYLRTTRLIESIKKSSILNLFENTNSINQKYYLNYKDFINLDLLLTVDINKIIKINSNKIILAYGWNNIEEWGIWSKNENSRIIFKINKMEKDKNIDLILKSEIFASQTPTKIFLNEHFLGEYILNGLNRINLPNNLINDGLINIEFRNYDIKSPKDLGISEDNRKIKLGLEYLKIEEN